MLTVIARKSSDDKQKESEERVVVIMTKTYKYKDMSLEIILFYVYLSQLYTIFQKFRGDLISRIPTFQIYRVT